MPTNQVWPFLNLKYNPYAFCTFTFKLTFETKHQFEIVNLTIEFNKDYCKNNIKLNLLLYFVSCNAVWIKEQQSMPSPLLKAL